MLELKNVDSFYGAAHILRSLSLRVNRHEVVALLGRNGAGKSTTLKSIMGLLRPRGGMVTYEGRQISGLAVHKICALGIGYVPEDRRIFPGLTVAENLEVGRLRYKGEGTAWTVERLYTLFPNLAERRRNLGGRLSGGEQQMLSIARTLMGNPRLLLLDEPSEGIAPIIVEQLARAIIQLKNEGLAVLLSEQNLHFARLICARAYILEKGEVRYEGDFAQLEAQPEVRAQYLAV